jgi:hypothetical protein
MKGVCVELPSASQGRSCCSPGAIARVWRRSRAIASSGMDAVPEAQGSAVWTPGSALGSHGSAVGTPGSAVGSPWIRRRDPWIRRRTPLDPLSPQTGFLSSSAGVSAAFSAGGASTARFRFGENSRRVAMGRSWGIDGSRSCAPFQIFIIRSR